MRKPRRAKADSRVQPDSIWKRSTPTLGATDGTTNVAQEGGLGSSIRGYVERFADGAIQGWALSVDRPDVRVAVLIKIDGKIVASGLADRFRHDLVEAFGGDGRHFFSIRVPVHKITDKSQTVEVIEKNSKVALQAAFTDLILDQAAIQSPEQEFNTHELYKLFDTIYYLSQVQTAVPPMDHYRLEGWLQGLNPHPLFDTLYYTGCCSEKLVEDPLTHFFRIGRHLNYQTHPLFDVDKYLRDRPDVARSGLHPLLHYLEYGFAEQTSPSDFFSNEYYEHSCPGVREAGFIPIIHYLSVGWREGRKPHPDFDPAVFKNVAEIADHVEPFTYFVRETLLAGRKPSIPATAPKISVLILNLNKTLFTLQCLFHLRRNTNLAGVEIIVLDNGSTDEQFATLCKYGNGIQIVRVGVNRGFGEGNNIAAEAASGEYLVFLNNDAFVLEGWLPPLLQAVQDNVGIGAAGPKLLYPDGSLQEAGATVSSCGTAVQRGKHLEGYQSLFDEASPVDYCSAAALLVRSDSFRRVFGFDLCWDPAYYEDADLCLKLRLLGQGTIYVPQSIVVHVENGTSSDGRLNLRLHDVVKTNRVKFVSRWGPYLSGNGKSANGLLANNTFGRVPESRGLPRLGLYTPYSLTPGGGERYLLSIAHVLRHRFDCTLVTPDRYSQLRLATMGRELEIDLQHVRLASIDRVAAGEPFDLFIAMGNEVLPPVPGLGRVNIYHCQFPFPVNGEHLTRAWDRLRSYHTVIVNSAFTAHHFVEAARRLNLDHPPVHVLSPPVPQVDMNGVTGQDGPSLILNVGRFAPGGHCKRQDVMIDVFRSLLAQTKVPLELHLAGSLGSESASREYLSSLQKAARRLPIHFHVSVSPAQIHDLYRRANVYWHITGIGEDISVHPERFEHFGITIAEAMSAGVVPIALCHGGPAEIISDRQDGFLVSNETELLETTVNLLGAQNADRRRLAVAAMRKASVFSIDRFSETLNDILEKFEQTYPALRRPGPQLESAIAHTTSLESDDIDSQQSAVFFGV